MKLPSKKEVVEEIQTFLLVMSMNNGFMCAYLFAWLAFGLPINGIMMFVSIVLGHLSTWGLIEWIERTDYEITE